MYLLFPLSFTFYQYCDNGFLSFPWHTSLLLFFHLLLLSPPCCFLHETHIHLHDAFFIIPLQVLCFPAALLRGVVCIALHLNVFHTYAYSQSACKWLHVYHGSRVLVPWVVQCSCMQCWAGISTSRAGKEDEGVETAKGVGYQLLS